MASRKITRVKGPKLTFERAREVLRLDPITSQLSWTAGKKGRKRRSFDTPGYVRADGYHVVGIDGRYYYAHRLIWLLLTGMWPDKIIDHKDRNPSNNAPANLRSATVSQNSANIDKWNAKSTSGFRGVYWHKVRARNGKDISRWCAMSGTTYIGHFLTAEEASAAYDNFVQQKYGEFVGPAMTSASRLHRD